MRKIVFSSGKKFLVLLIALILIAVVSCTTASPTPTTPGTTTPPATTTSPPATTTSPTPTAGSPTGTSGASPTATSPGPTATGTASPAASPTASPAASPSPTASPAASPSPTASPAASPSPTASPAASPSPTASPTASPSPSASPAGQIGPVEVLAVWGGSELESFRAMVAPWEQQTGGSMNFTGTRDLTAVLQTRIQANNPPDIAILPNPGLMRQFATAGNLEPLAPMLNMSEISQQYPQDWIDLGTVDGDLYALFMKATNKATIWYNPKTFTANNWTIPETWDELIALSDQIVAEGKVPANPWSVGVEAAQASGFPGTDWIAQIFLSKYGGEAYDQWVNHEIPWTDPRVKDAWEMFGTIVNTPNYVAGGTTAVLATNFQDASYLPFQDPPRAAMYYEGDFVQGFISAQFPDLVGGEDYSFFPFPAVSEGTAPPTASPGVSPSPTMPASPTGSPAASPTGSPAASPSPGASPSPAMFTAVTAGADLIVAFKDTPTIRSFISYLASPQAQTIWVERGGFTSLNRDVDPGAYPNDLARMTAEGLVNAPLSRFGLGDVIPGSVQTAWWAGVLQYLQNPGQLDAILSNIENVAVTASQGGASPSPTGAASPSPTVMPSPLPTSTP